MHEAPLTLAVHKLAESIMGLGVALTNLTGLNRLEQKVDTMAQTQKEVAADVRTATQQLQKISRESTRTLALVEDLRKQLAEAGIDPELLSAVDELKAQIQAVDDLTPDEQPPQPVNS